VAEALPWIVAAGGAALSLWGLQRASHWRWRYESWREFAEALLEANKRERGK
jgi:hypothetical protein